ncbi:MAG: HlyD family efflux transporter periplasmic adaptor subunit [Pseudomonadota bacterium]
MTGAPAEEGEEEAPPPPLPRLRPELRFDWRETPEGPSVVVEDPVGGGFYDMDLAAAELLRLLDGTCSPEDAWRRVAATGLGDELSREEAQEAVEEAARLGLFAAAKAGAPARPRKPRLGLVSQRIPLGAHDARFAAWARRLSWAFGPVGTVIWLAVMAWGGAVLVARWPEFLAELGSLFTAGSALYLVAAWLIAKVWHEIHHGLVARRYGVEIRETGVLLILFLPLGAYVDVSGIWRLRDRWKRLHVTAAGLSGELLLGALALVLWAEAEPGGWRIFLQAFVVTTTLSAVLFNINPLMRFDGYHALVDLTGLPNLYQRGGEAVTQRTLRVLCGPEGSAPADRPGVELYGWLSLGWRVLLTVSIALLAAGMAFGFGLALGAAAVWVMVAVPLSRLAGRLWALGPRARRRAALRGAALAGLAAAALFAPLPRFEAAPAVLAHRDAAAARAGVSGRVTEVLVGPGEAVAAGQPLLRLVSEDLVADRRRASVEIARERLAAAQALAEGALSEARAAERRAAVRQAELSELEARAGALTLAAPRAGRVLDARPGDLAGRWVRRGAPLLEIADPAGLEVRAWLTPDLAERLAEARGAAAEAEFQLVDRFGRRLPARLTRLLPAASDAPPPEVLTAAGGGPLELDLSGESPRLAVARVEARFSVSSQDGAPAVAGTPGRLKFATRYLSFASTLPERFRNFDLSDPAGWLGALGERG